MSISKAKVPKHGEAAFFGESLENGNPFVRAFLDSGKIKERSRKQKVSEFDPRKT
ncbi:hypothetical protein [Leptospira gomenensis]|uniref:hypothetical protein n=1 Tax=Leptospira gomenensis TaxID=2484974 RepID=UPI0014384A69|nr:hypothetical protein [Leptospira gomenensis]